MFLALPFPVQTFAGPPSLIPIHRFQGTYNTFCFCYRELQQLPAVMLKDYCGSTSSMSITGIFDQSLPIANVTSGLITLWQPQFSFFKPTLRYITGHRGQTTPPLRYCQQFTITKQVQLYLKTLHR